MASNGFHWCIREFPLDPLDDTIGSWASAMASGFWVQSTDAWEFWMIVDGILGWKNMSQTKQSKAGENESKKPCSPFSGPKIAMVRGLQPRRCPPGVSSYWWTRWVQAVEVTERIASFATARLRPHGWCFMMVNEWLVNWWLIMVVDQNW